MPEIKDPAVEFERGLRVALAVCYDAQRDGVAAQQPIARLSILRMATVLLEIGTDYQAACDFDPISTGEQLLAMILGAGLGKDPAR